MAGFEEKSNIQSHENSTENCVRYICTQCLDYQKIECPELRKFNGKLCTLYMYGMYGLAEKSNIQNSVNSTRNCERYICAECLN